jgi:hypothetical protein
MQKKPPFARDMLTSVVNIRIHSEGVRVVNSVPTFEVLFDVLRETLFVGGSVRHHKKSLATSIWSPSRDSRNPRECGRAVTPTEAREEVEVSRGNKRVMYY